MSSRAQPAERSRRKAIVFAGPTASGKSAAALAAARAVDGVVINADSMQVYRDLAVLTARPSAAIMTEVPHRLYGVLSARESCSAARWRAMAIAEIEAAAAQGKVPILAGGTGLYLRALAAGLAAIPPIPAAVREHGRRLRDAEGPVAFHRRLARADPATAANLSPSDRQRVLRAWEVVTATGVPLRDWQRRATSPDRSPELLTFVFLPPRAILYQACDRRFERMLAEGAIEEAKALLDRGLAPDLPAMKAVGVREIEAYLRGEIDRARLAALGQQSTRRYAKRQYTWFRHQVPAAMIIEAQFSESLSYEIFTKIRDFILTAPPQPD